MIGAVRRVTSDSGGVTSVVDIVSNVTFRAGVLTLGTTIRTTHTNRRNHNFTIITNRIHGLTDHDTRTTGRVGTLVRSSISHISANSILIRDTKRAVGGVIGTIAHIASVVNRVTSTSSRRDHNVSRITLTISRVSHIARRGTSLIRRSTTTTTTLRRRTDHLARTISTFHLTTDPLAGGPRAPSHPTDRRPPTRPQLQVARRSPG